MVMKELVVPGLGRVFQGVQSTPTARTRWHPGRCLIDMSTQPHQCRMQFPRDYFKF